MPKKIFKPEEIIQHLRTYDIGKGKGLTMEQIAKKIGVAVPTLGRWRREYGGLRVDQARRLKDLERENARLKRLVADKELDISILKEATSGNY